MLLELVNKVVLSREKKDGQMPKHSGIGEGAREVIT